MPSHEGCWVILAADAPTAFRSKRREHLIPTLRQLQRTHPDAVLRWFSAGRFWDSPEAARLAALAKRTQKRTRSADWRPGGEHKDPNARYQLTRAQKRARYKSKMRRQKGPS